MPQLDFEPCNGAPVPTSLADQEQITAGSVSREAEKGVPRPGWAAPMDLEPLGWGRTREPGWAAGRRGAGSLASQASVVGSVLCLASGQHAW